MLSTSDMVWMVLDRRISDFDPEFDVFRTHKMGYLGAYTRTCP